jgi:hypothetical protein
MNVFLGIRYGLWDALSEPARVATVVNELLARGLAPTRG